MKCQVSALEVDAERQAEQEARVCFSYKEREAAAQLLTDRIHRAKSLNENLHKRYSVLTMLTSCQPRPLSHQAISIALPY